MSWKELCLKSFFKIIRIYQKKNKKSPLNWTFYSSDT